MEVFINIPIIVHTVDGETKLKCRLTDSRAHVLSQHYFRRESRSSGTVSCPLHALPLIVLAEPLPLPSQALGKETGMG